MVVVVVVVVVVGTVVVVQGPHSPEELVEPRLTTPAKALLAVARAMREYLTMMIEI